MVALYITRTYNENRLSVPVTARNLNAPSCSVAQGVTENGAMNDSADIPATRDGTAPPGRLRASTSGMNTAVMREPSVFWAVPQKFVDVDGLSIQVLTAPSMR